MLISYELIRVWWKWKKSGKQRGGWLNLDVGKFGQRKVGFPGEDCRAHSKSKSICTAPFDESILLHPGSIELHNHQLPHALGTYLAFPHPPSWQFSALGTFLIGNSTKAC